MRHNIFIALLICYICFPQGVVDACTSAIFTGKVTADGRPLLWKHRDTGEENNRIEFFEGEKHAFLALVNSPAQDGEAWAGTNGAGFSIMNTASYNIKDDDVKEMDKEAVLMFKALGVCADLAEFERFLDEYPRPMRVEANFGVIDAKGGAAYYEVNNTAWTKIDANDPKIAPDGFLVSTNFSYTGRFGEGMGYIRYQTAREIVSRRAPHGDITPHWIFDNLSRSFYHSLQEIDLTKDRLASGRDFGWVVDQDYIPRRITSASVVIQGVKQGENPEMTILWAVLGYPPAGVAVPLWVKAGAHQPAVMLKSDASENAAACDLALALKRKTFSLKRGNGDRYMNFATVFNASGTGYMQELAPAEAAVRSLFRDAVANWRENGLDTDALRSLNREVSGMFPGFYQTLTVNQSN